MVTLWVTAGPRPNFITWGAETVSWVTGLFLLKSRHPPLPHSVRSWWARAREPD